MERLNVFDATIPCVLKFLSEQFEEGASYGTINTYRSALAQILGPEIGENSSIKTFCKGASNLRPPGAKYDCTWDPKLVLECLSKWHPNEEISSEQLSLKLATLLALTTGHTMQTLLD